MMALYGFGYAPVKVSSFVRSQSAAIYLGFGDNIETYSLISGEKLNINCVLIMIYLDEGSSLYFRLG